MQSLSPLLSSIHRVISSHSSVTVALSGGIDSVVMLHACVALSKLTDKPFDLTAVHIHHGLSANADAWLLFCQQLCDELEVPLKYQKVGVQAEARRSLEELARNARYSAISHLAPKQALVLLGQHEDDQAETFLLQLKRGAGPKGLAGMAERFKREGAIEYARPWINAGIGRQEIEAYAAQFKLEWIEDESNQDNAFDRNFLRNEVLPKLVAKWPQINKTIVRSAALCAAQNSLVERFAREALDKIVQANMTLSLSALRVLPNDLVNEVLRLWTIDMTDRPVSLAQLSEIRKLCEAKADQVGYVQINQWQCRNYQQCLFWVSLSEIIDEARSSQLITLEVNGKPADVEISFGGLNRKARLFNNRPSKSIKDWMKELQIPPWRRLGMAVLTIDMQVVGLQCNTHVIFNDAFTFSAGAHDAVAQLLKHTVPR